MPPIYEFTAPVIKGNGLGHSFGAPTLNQTLPDDEAAAALPYGVYFSRCELDGTEYPAVSNVGVKPTINGISPPAVESFLFGYSGDAYGKVVRTSLLKFRRPEKKFPDREALFSAISRNVDAAAEFFGVENVSREDKSK
ncbi:MAG: riboflavin kinase [Clostridia bacterium]|nr:riboflavin kinase [Clostridia bacterium]